MSKITGRVVEVLRLTDRVSGFRIVSAKDGVLPAFSAGSHVIFDLPGGETRAYSLISFEPIPDAPKEYRVAVQREPDGKGGSVQMHGLSAGSPVTFCAPKNDFPLDLAAPAVLLAGGIGITPMISMATMLKHAGQDFSFHYAGRSLDVMAFTDDLVAAFGDTLILHADDDPSTALDLDGVIAGLGDAHLYVCGPRGMIDAARACAEAAGVPAAHIHFELFEAAASDEGDTAFEVEISSGDVYTVAPGQTIIEALEDAGVDVMYDCQRGDCGICQTDVISGDPDHRDVVLSQAERDSGKVMQICVSRSKSPRLVLDI